MIPALDPPCRAGEDDLGHVNLDLDAAVAAAALLSQSALDACDGRT
jgi:hypothetical protein